MVTDFVCANELLGSEPTSCASRTANTPPHWTPHAAMIVSRTRL
ncbi:hypothetical protein RHOER0001_4578 [Rhodococcus erythropolis SK121]|nr:hypothetical protein RHOER0001_4578 [Rhodococcus erythropolis SK121]